jgi:hypothetical protein
MTTSNTGKDPSDNWQQLYSASNEHWKDLRRSGNLLIPVVFIATIATLYAIIFTSFNQADWLTNTGGKLANSWWLFRIIITTLSPLLVILIGAFFLIRENNNFIRKFYQPSEQHKIGTLVRRRLMGVPPLPPPLNALSHYPFITLREPELNNDHWACWLGGPATLVIYDGTALYLERGNCFSRVVGPGSPPMPFLERYETVRAVVDLRPQVKTGKINGWTKDGIPVEMEVRMECQIDASPKAKEKSSNLVYPFDPLAVKLAVEHTTVRYDSATRRLSESDWLDGMWGQVSGFFLGYIISRSLDELFLDESGKEQIFAPRVSQDGIDKLNNNISKMNLGAHFLNLQITKVTLPEIVVNQRLAYWESERGKMSLILEGKAEAERIRMREKANADVVRDMLDTITDHLKPFGKDNLTEPVLLSLTSILDQNLDDPMVRPLIAKETLSMLEKVRQRLKEGF